MVRFNYRENTHPPPLLLFAETQIEHHLSTMTNKLKLLDLDAFLEVRFH